MQADISQQEIVKNKDGPPSFSPSSAVSNSIDFAPEPHGIPLVRTFSHLPQVAQGEAFKENNEEKNQSTPRNFPQESQEDRAMVSILSVQKEVLPTSNPAVSIQGEEGETTFFTRDYQQLSAESITDQLYAFLEPMGISRGDIRRAGISETHLVRLFQQETSRFAGLKWSTLDHALEKLLQWPLLHPKEVGFLLEKSCIARIKPVERSILLKNQWGLIKAYGARGFAKGLELGLTQLVQYFISAMLIYRLITLMQTGEFTFKEFQAMFQGSDEKGIDSLVVTLAHLDTAWLKFILTAPLVLGCIQSLPSMVGSRATTSARLRELQQEITDHLAKAGGVWRDVIWEGFPILSSFLSLTSQLQKLERLVRWDGRLTVDQRKQVFELVCQVATNGEKLTQLNAMECLAKIAHGIGIKDFKRLHAAGYTQEELVAALYTKVTAYATLESLSQPMEEEKSRTWRALPQRVYAGYLLWWLGQSSSFWKQQLPFLLFKTAKLGISILFLQRIIASILEAIRCPDRQGFELGFGYSQYANLLTVDCYLQMIAQFRTVNLSDSVEQLVNQIRYFNLQGLNNLELYYKNLTGDEMVAILQNSELVGARFFTLYIYDHFSNSDMRALAYYLNTSNIQALDVGCHSPIDGVEIILNSIGFEYLVDILPYATNLSSLRICFPNVDNDGISALACIFNKTKINQLDLHYINIDDLTGEKFAEVLATMQMTKVFLQSDGLGDSTIYALEDLTRNNPLLQEFVISGNFITNEGAIFYSQLIANSSLKIIGCCGLGVTNQGVEAIGNNIIFTAVEQLYIDSNSSESGMIALFNQLNKTNLQLLEIADNLFTVYIIKALNNALNSTKIQSLQFSDDNWDNDTIATLADGIASSSIRNLLFMNNDLQEYFDLLAPSVFNLENLNLTNCSLSSEHLIFLTSFLADSRIQQLSLPKNNITDDGVLALVQVLPMTQVNSLDLSNNNITDVGAQALADIYPSTSLQTLLLTGNNISSDILYQVENFQWQAYCQDQLCHADAQYNGGVSSQGQALTKGGVVPTISKCSTDPEDSSMDASSTPFTFGQGSSIEVMEEHDLVRENPWKRAESEDLVLSEQSHDSSALTKSTLPLQAAIWVGLQGLAVLQSPVLTDPSMMPPQETSYSSPSDNWMAISTLACGLLSLSAGVGIILYKKSVSIQDKLQSCWKSAQQFSLWKRSSQSIPTPVIRESPNHPSQIAVSRF